MADEKLSAENLKNVLWETIRDLRAKNIDTSVANAIATQSREVMRIVKVELVFAKAVGKKPNIKLLNG